MKYCTHGKQRLCWSISVLGQQSSGTVCFMGLTLHPVTPSPVTKASLFRFHPLHGQHSLPYCGCMWEACSHRGERRQLPKSLQLLFCWHPCIDGPKGPSPSPHHMSLHCPSPHHMSLHIPTFSLCCLSSNL